MIKIVKNYNKPIFSDMTVYDTGRIKQKRKHKKKRINKKWRKRYGFEVQEMQEQDVLAYQGKIFMKHSVYEKFITELAKKRGFRKKRRI